MNDEMAVGCVMPFRKSDASSENPVLPGNFSHLHQASLKRHVQRGEIGVGAFQRQGKRRL